MPFTNKLINETSPYLLQHAHNPVNWFPWGEEAFNKALKENKPILVSIGYAACHWCHVMERESFEDESTAILMNEHFVNIKIDREERPDLDHIYMDALQALTGSGGWPLHVFLTPDRKPFYGGTYFPPQRAYNRPSWKETLISISQTFREKRNEVDAQAENLTDHLVKSNVFGLHMQDNGDDVFTRKKIQEAVGNIMKSADKEWGGFGRAPKFPQTFSIQFLLRYHHISGNKEALGQALLSLDKMIEGGIYDQVGGGFARYSTDTEWLVPHFEKMLYDNALIISVLSEAFQLTGKERYKEVISETINFVQRELLHIQKGFFSALDADSEGIEGKFYVWTMGEVNELIGKEAAIFCEYYDITPKGNWEGKNICRVKMPMEEFARVKQITISELKRILETGKNKLLERREKRIRPLLDDKIILGWNGLMNTACCKAYAATGREEFLNLAIENMEFILSAFSEGEGNGFHHTWKNKQAKYPAFLDDYAFLIEALLNLQEITAQTKWLDKAVFITNYVIEHFSEEETGFFFYTPVGQRDLIVRKKEIYDGAVPSGNAVMAKNLLTLGLLIDRNDWKTRALKMTSSLHKAIISYPTSFGNWLCQLLEIVEGTHEIVLIGSDIDSLKNEILQQYIPHRVIMASEKANNSYPLLAGKGVTNKRAIYLCRNNTCQAPVFSTEDLISLINRSQKE